LTLLWFVIFEAELADIPGMEQFKIFEITPESPLEPREYAVFWKNAY
jgi:hypothetical protein